MVDLEFLVSDAENPMSEIMISKEREAAIGRWRMVRGAFLEAGRKEQGRIRYFFVVRMRGKIMLRKRM